MNERGRRWWCDTLDKMIQKLAMVSWRISDGVFFSLHPLQNLEEQLTSISSRHMESWERIQPRERQIFWIKMIIIMIVHLMTFSVQNRKSYPHMSSSLAPHPSTLFFSLLLCSRLKTASGRNARLSCECGNNYFPTQFMLIKLRGCEKCTDTQPRPTEIHNI
jgi:hypothetical protein